MRDVADGVEIARVAGRFAEEIVPFKTQKKVTDKATQKTHTEEVTLDRGFGS